ncbi:MAG: DUF4251 domain-containing protein [Bacteroidales bacterium]|nr:DUF4251 domain-containing protein [Bacteroidales bacterium]
MKKIIYISLAYLLIAASCSSSGEMTALREERKAANKEEVREAVESQRMLIRVNKIHPRRGGVIEMRPESNFVIIDQDRVRISLGYLGRSHSIRPVSAINMQGEIYSREIGSWKKGGYDMEFEMGQDSEKFTVYMTISSDGYVDLRLTNPRLDLARYSGRLESL